MFTNKVWEFKKKNKRLKSKRWVTYRLLYGSKHAAFDVGDGLRVDGGELVDQPVVQRKQGKVEEETLSHRLFSPGSSHLCLGKNNEWRLENILKGSLENYKALNKVPKHHTRDSSTVTSPTGLKLYTLAPLR